MSIAQRNEIEELKRKVDALERRVDELEADATWMKKEDAPKGNGLTLPENPSRVMLTLPEKRKGA